MWEGSAGYGCWIAESDGNHQVILLPGAVLPAALAYADLLEALSGEADAVAKELELYRADRPPSDYGLESEIAGISRVAEAEGFERFHLVGYSAGGASALAFSAAHPDRVLSLALLEPAWTGNNAQGPEERAVWRKMDEAMALPAAERLPHFIRLQLAEGVDPPPPPAGDPPPWMAKRPAGIAAVTDAFKRHEIDPDSLRSFDRPVYYALGALSNPDLYARPADRLGALFSQFTLERFEERHHFEPPHRFEPERLAKSLKATWESAGWAPEELRTRVAHSRTSAQTGRWSEMK